MRNAYVWRIYVSFRIAVFVWHSQFVKAIVMIDFHIIQKDPFIISFFLYYMIKFILKQPALLIHIALCLEFYNDCFEK